MSQIFSSPVLNSHHKQHLASRLSAMQEHFFYRKVQVVVLNHITLPVASENTNSVLEVKKDDSMKESKESKSKVVTPVSEEKNERPETSFMQRVRSMIDEKKEWYEERKRRNEDEKGKELRQGRGAHTLFIAINKMYMN